MLKIVDSFKDCRTFTYEKVRDIFQVNKETTDKHGNAQSQIDMERDRYQLVFQRMHRHKLFQQPALSKRRKQAAYTVVTTHSISFDTNDRQALFGALYENREGQLIIDGEGRSVNINIDNVKLGLGLFTYNSMVLCEGVYNSMRDYFEVDSMGFPPKESRKCTVTDFPVLNFYPADKEKKRLKIEKENDDEMFVFISQVHLDVKKVWKGLETMFEGYSGQAPKCFIFCGDYTKERLSNNVTDLKKLQRLFDKLTILILKYPVLVKGSQFIFVPGPRDPGMGNIVPAPRLMKIITRKMEQKLTVNGKCKAIFTSNPCRIQYCTQILIFRSDLLQKLRRNCVIPPDIKQCDKLEKHLVTTVLAQAHLCPVPILCQPRYWQYDHALRMYPLPDV
eukprot:UN06553